MSDIRTEESIIVEGFAFADEEEAKQAKREAEGVKYIREKTEMDNPEVVLQIYNKMVQQKLFETTVGFTYLKGLQQYLKSIPFIQKTDILPIPVIHPTLEKNMGARTSKKSSPMPKKAAHASKKQTHAAGENTQYRSRFLIMTFVSAVLALCVVGMFAIQIMSKSPTILNYENEIIDRYERWEQELTEREAVIEEREKELGINE